MLHEHFIVTPVSDVNMLNMELLPVQIVFRWHPECSLVASKVLSSEIFLAIIMIHCCTFALHS